MLSLQHTSSILPTRRTARKEGGRINFAKIRNSSVLHNGYMIHQSVVEECSELRQLINSELVVKKPNPAPRYRNSPSMIVVARFFKSPSNGFPWYTVPRAWGIDRFGTPAFSRIETGALWPPHAVFRTQLRNCSWFVQEDATRQCVRALQESSCASATLVKPCGTGKTITACAIMAQLKVKTIVLVTTQQQVLQLYQTLTGLSEFARKKKASTATKANAKVKSRAKPKQKPKPASKSQNKRSPTIQRTDGANHIDLKSKQGKRTSEEQPHDVCKRQKTPPDSPKSSLGVRLPPMTQAAEITEPRARESTRDLCDGCGGGGGGDDGNDGNDGSDCNDGVSYPPPPTRLTEEFNESVGSADLSRHTSSFENLRVGVVCGGRFLVEDCDVVIATVQSIVALQTKKLKDFVATASMSTSQSTSQSTSPARGAAARLRHTKSLFGSRASRPQPTRWVCEEEQNSSLSEDDRTWTRSYENEELAGSRVYRVQGQPPTECVFRDVVDTIRRTNDALYSKPWQQKLRVWEFGLVVVDECHHLPTDSFLMAIQAFPAAKRLFMTATPRRDDGIPLDALTGPITFLQKPVWRFTHVSIAKWYNRALALQFRGNGDDQTLSYQGTLDCITNDERRNEFIVQVVRRLLSRGHRRVIVVSKSVAHIEHLAEMINADSSRVCEPRAQQQTPVPTTALTTSPNLEKDHTEQTEQTEQTQQTAPLAVEKTADSPSSRQPIAAVVSAKVMGAERKSAFESRVVLGTYGLVAEALDLPGVTALVKTMSARGLAVCQQADGRTKRGAPVYTFPSNGKSESMVLPPTIVDIVDVMNGSNLFERHLYGQYQQHPHGHGGTKDRSHHRGVPEHQPGRMDYYFHNQYCIEQHHIQVPVEATIPPAASTPCATPTEIPTYHRDGDRAVERSSKEASTHEKPSAPPLKTKVRREMTVQPTILQSLQQARVHACKIARANAVDDAAKNATSEGPVYNKTETAHEVSKSHTTERVQSLAEERFTNAIDTFLRKLPGPFQPSDSEESLRRRALESWDRWRTYHDRHAAAVQGKPPQAPLAAQKLGLSDDDNDDDDDAMANGQNRTTRTKSSFLSPRTGSLEPLRPKAYRWNPIWTPKWSLHQ